MEWRILKMIELNRAILGKQVFVSKNWISNNSFAIKKAIVRNSEDFISEEIFSRLSNFKGLKYKFDLKDENFENFYKEKSFDVVYSDTHWKYNYENFELNLFAKDEFKMLLDTRYVKFFEIENIYGLKDKDSVVFIDKKENPNLIICDFRHNILDENVNTILYDTKIQDDLKITKGNSKLNKFFQ